MTKLKSHLVFSNKQRNGIFLLIIVIVLLQVVLFTVDFNPKSQDVNQQLIDDYNREIDSLIQSKQRESEQKIYPFNPNYITDYRGYTLGMSTEEIDRFLKFRQQNKWVNSAAEFQQVTQISDSLLQTIAPYFKFPEWVTNQNNEQVRNVQTSSVSKTEAQKIDLNTATALQLQRINGIGETLSQRIITYRDKQPNGFIADIQLTEIYGITPELVEKITHEFTVKTPAPITKINLNTASIETLVTIKYIDYEIAFNIIETRTLRDGFHSLDELTKVKDFPVNKLEIIKLYLTL